VFGSGSAGAAALAGAGSADPEPVRVPKFNLAFHLDFAPTGDLDFLVRSIPWVGSHGMRDLITQLLESANWWVRSKLDLVAVAMLRGVGARLAKARIPAAGWRSNAVSAFFSCSHFDLRCPPCCGRVSRFYLRLLRCIGSNRRKVAFAGYGGY